MPTAARTVRPTAVQIVAPTAAPTVVRTAVPIAASASERVRSRRLPTQATARRAGRLCGVAVAVLALWGTSPVCAQSSEEADTLLRAPDDRERALSAEIEVGLGIESYRNPVALIGDDGTTIELGRGGQRVSSAFREATLGVDVELPAGVGWAWTAAWNMEARRLSELSELDHDNHTLALGVLRELGEGELGAEALFERLDVAHGDFRRRASGLRLQYLLRRDERSAQGVSVEWKRYRHGVPDDIEDGDRVSLAWVVRRADEWGDGWRARLAVAALANRWGYDDFSYRELSARLERVLVPAPGWTLNLGVAPRWTHFMDAAPDADFTRRDRRVTAVAGIGRAFGEHASVQCEAELGRRLSTDTLLSSRWHTAGCSVRLTF